MLKVKSRTVRVFAGWLLWALAGVFGIAAVAIAPFIVWPAAVAGLLPFSYTATAWLDIASLPGCFLLGAAAVGALELGSQALESA